jgi:hypothetical protein
MSATRSALLAFAFSGALLAGCGGGSTSGSTTTSTPATNPAGQTTSTRSAATSGSLGVGVAQYLAICRSRIKEESRLSMGKRAKLEGMCDKVSRGDLAGARAITKEVCVEVIAASPISTVARAKALAACKSS